MLSIPHLIVLFIVALVVFGPEKLPELARNLGKAMAEFRRVTGDMRSTFEGHLRDLEREADARRIAAPAASTPAATAASTVTPNTTPPPASPGTVPSNPPNAAAIAGPTGSVSSPAATSDATDIPDPMHDPYLAQMDFPSHDSPSASEPPKTELNPEQVSDGDRRHS